jgi:hypothetical protein
MVYRRISIEERSVACPELEHKISIVCIRCLICPRVRILRGNKDKKDIRLMAKASGLPPPKAFELRQCPRLGESPCAVVYRVGCAHRLRLRQMTHKWRKRV